MSNKVEKGGLVPRLRFPEFREAGDWEETKLGLIGSFTGGGTPSKDQTSYWTGTNPWISSSDISDDNIKNISISRFISDKAIQETATKLVPKNSILLVSRVGVGKLAITRLPICTSQDFTNFTPAKDNLLFLAYCLKSLRNTFLAFNQGMAIKGFTKDDASNLTIPLPTQGEQQKIADCLTSLDELITLEAQQLDTLKSHKKGLMQQLFPDEGETLPRLRFPEFQDAGNWEARRLEEFAVIVRGGSPRPIDEYITDDAHGLNWLKIGDIDKESKYVTSTQDKVIPAALNKTRMVSPGDLILSNSMSFGRPYILEIHTCIHDGWIAVSKIDIDLDRDYLYYLMMTSASQTYFSDNAAGSGVQNLNVDIIKLLPVSFPCKKEQQKIADCLTTLDDLITAQTQKLAALKVHKQGLMQQLFPALEEVTA